MRNESTVSLMTPSVLYEIAEKLQTPRLGLPIDLRIDFVDLVGTLSEFVPTRRLDIGCRDEDNDRLVETGANVVERTPLSSLPFVADRNPEHMGKRLTRGLDRRSCDGCGHARHFTGRAARWLGRFMQPCA
jgi:hypothetical protein